jgi:glycosyltransferase involved in cell wall biosynthesis
VRLLFLTETVPWPLDSGGRVRTYHTLAALIRAHEVHLHAFARTEAQRGPAERALSSLTDHVSIHVVPRSVTSEAAAGIRALVRGTPFTVERHFNRRAWKAIHAAAARTSFDAVYCDHLSMLEYGSRLGLPIILDAHNVEYLIVERFARRQSSFVRRRVALAESRRLERFERRMYPACGRIIAVSEVDAAAIRSMAGPGVLVTDVPIPVDTGEIRPVAEVTGVARVLFVGPLDWPPNAEAVEWFLEHVWSTVQKHVPDASCHIVGRRPERILPRFRRLPGVHFTGWVEEVASHFAVSRLLVVPIQSGSGMRVKILEAFARGIPVVTTSIGIEGICAAQDLHCRIADDPGAFANDVVHVLRADATARRLAAAARTLVEERYSTAVVSQMLLTILDGSKAQESEAEMTKVRERTAERAYPSPFVGLVRNPRGTAIAKMTSNPRNNQTPGVDHDQ